MTISSEQGSTSLHTYINSVSSVHLTEETLIYSHNEAYLRIRDVPVLFRRPGTTPHICTRNKNGSRRQTANPCLEPRTDRPRDRRQSLLPLLGSVLACCLLSWGVSAVLFGRALLLLL